MAKTKEQTRAETQAREAAAQGNFLRKITVAGIGATPDLEVLLKQSGKQMLVARVYGVARRAKPEMGKEGRGDYVKFYGQFKAVNVVTGESFVSGALILPGVVQDQLYGAMDGDVQGVEFAVDIGAKYDPDAVTKYVYFAKSLIKPKDNDPLLLMEKQLAGLKALPAPAAQS